MFDELVKSFASMKIAIETNGIGGDASAQLDGLNQRFVLLLEDWSLLDPDHQGMQTSAFISAQADFHFAAGRMLTALRIEPSNEGVIEQTDGTPMELNEVQDKEQPSSSAAISQNINIEHEQEQSMDSGSNQEQVHATTATQPVKHQAKPMASLSYHDHSRVLDPVYSLSPMEYIDEGKLNDIINCIHETMRRANELEIMVPSEVVLTIIAYIHGLLDFTSQSMLSWRFTDERATLDSLVEFLQTRATRILPIERAPMPSTSIGPSAPKKSKKGMVCPLCNGNHALIRCDEYKSLPANQRRRQVARLNLCENCLMANHTVIQCNHGACKKCNSKHNSTLPCPPDGARGGQ